ncbi:MAG: MATE family efflux transporter [Clostridia bacterium]|nr:MATE family efflux transporter [Clostridia bacterium]MBR6604031.1 MATE family efflux transporter [Clostridia bacterium]
MILTKDKSFYKSLILLAIPMVLQNLITFSVGLADNIMIGTLGDSAVSGVYMGNQVQTVLQVLSTGIEGGLLLLAAQYWGKRDTDAVRRIVSIGLRFCLVLGLVFSVVCAVVPSFVIDIFTNEVAVIEKGSEYLSILAYSFFFFCLTQALIVSMRSVEVARIGLWVSLCSLVINIGLNYLLIFGKLGFPALEVKGAAIATLVSRFCEALLMVIYVAFVDKKLKIRFSHLLKIDKLLLRDYIKYGIPILMGQLVWGANLIANSIILGHFTESVITATSLANTVSSLMYVSLNGLSGAVGIIISKTVGSGDISRIKEYSHTTEILFLLLGILTGIGFALIRAPYIGLYNISEEAARYSSQFITVLCFTGIGTCYECGCLFGLVKSGGDVSFVFKNDTIFVFLVVIPSAIITAYMGLSPWIVYLCLKSDQILKCIVAFFKIRRFDWMKNLTRKTE